jgi:hypothetical protein
LYQSEERTFATGERVQFTTPWKEQGISNREMGTVTHLDEYGIIRVKLDHSNRTVGWNLDTYRHLDYAYAMTSHSAQGQTVDRVLIHIDTGDSRIRSLVDESLAYVATSRPRHDAQIFTDNAEALARALSSRHNNSTALSPEQIDRYADKVRKENATMPGVVADYVRQAREEENAIALAEAQDEPEQIMAMDQERENEYAEDTSQERIRDYSEGTWESDFDGLWEHRVNIGRSESGFHYDIESSYQGGEPTIQGWSAEAYPTPQAAETAAAPTLEALIDNGVAEDYEYSEGLSI